MYPELVTVCNPWESRLGKRLAALAPLSRCCGPANRYGRSLTDRPSWGWSLPATAGISPWLRPELATSPGRRRPGCPPGRGGRCFGALRLAVALLTGRLGRSRLYMEKAAVSLAVEMPAGGAVLSRDGESDAAPTLLTFDKRRRALWVYAP